MVVDFYFSRLKACPRLISMLRSSGNDLVS